MKISVFYHHIVQAAKQKRCTEDQILKKVREAGITAVELDRDDIKDQRALLEKLEKHQLAVSSVYGFYDFTKNDDMERCKQHIRFAQAMKADKIMIIPGFYSGEDITVRKRELENMVRGTKKLCEMAKAQNIRATIEDFDDERSPLCSVSGMKNFLSQIPELYVTLDTGNFIVKGEDEVEALEQLRGRMIHVHCKDRAYDKSKNICPSPVGKGFIKMDSIIKALLKTNYIGTVTIEHFGAEDYMDFMMESVRWIKKIIEEVKTNDKGDCME